MPTYRFTDVIHVERLVEVEADNEDAAEEMLTQGNFVLICEEQYDADTWELVTEETELYCGRHDQKPSCIHRDYFWTDVPAMARRLVTESRWFDVTPLPGNKYRITIKNEPGAEKALEP